MKKLYHILCGHIATDTYHGDGVGEGTAEGGARQVWDRPKK